MAELAINDLLAIMRDQKVGMRDRINAAVSVSRVAPLGAPGEPEPEAVLFLRHVINYKMSSGAQFSPGFRRECAAALAYYQRRVAKMLLTYEVPDLAERREAWRRILNGAIRYTLASLGRWPQDNLLLLAPGEPFNMPSADPERTLAALLLPAGAAHAQRRQRAVDDPGGLDPITSEAERRELIRPIAELVNARIAPPMSQ